MLKLLLHIACSTSRDRRPLNPVWPIPGVQETLETLRIYGVDVGLTSSAQFYMPLICEFLPGKHPALRVWFFAHGIAKPSISLFQVALDTLIQLHGIPPEGVLYGDNDAARDIQPAAQCGCLTAIFAFNRRSFCPPSTITPDVMPTDPNQPPECVAA